MLFRSCYPQRVLSYIESGKQQGARVVTGGTRGDGSGYFVKPTIFADVKEDMKIVREEIFGPVGVVIPFKTEEEVIEKANDTDYGLSSYVYTQNIGRAIRMANAIEAGCCFVSSWICLTGPRVLTEGSGQLCKSALPTGAVRRL